MASKAALAVGIRIGAVDDGATTTIQGIVDKANASAKGLMGGLAAGGAAYKIKEMLTDNSNEYAGQEYSFAKLRILEMNKLGAVNETVFGDEQNFIKGLSGTYAKTTEDYTKMVVVMRQNRIRPEEILGGIGEAGAKLGKVFDNLDPDKSALLFSRLKNDMRVSAGGMGQLANMAYKLYNVGVGGGDASQAVTELTEAYSKASLGATNLGLSGEKDAEELGILMGTFIAKGLSGTSVGTNFRRIFDGLTDPKKIGGVMANGLQFGIKFNFYDGQGKFRGLKAFEQEMAKMQNLSALQRGQILKPFGGKQGLSTDFLEYLAKFPKDVDAIRDQYDATANLDDAVKQLVGTIQIQNDKTESAKKNMKAAWGKATAEDVQRLNRLLQWTYKTIGDLADSSPHLANVSQEFLGATSAVLGLYGGLKIVGAYIPTLGGLATGLAATFSRLLPFFAGLFIAKGIWDKFGDTEAAKKRHLEENPNSQKSKLIRGYDEIINDPNKGWLKRYLAQKVQAGIIRNTQLFGDNSPGAEMGRDKMGFVQFGGGKTGVPVPGSGIDYNYGWRGKDQSNGSALENTLLSPPPTSPQITYAPNIVIPGGSAGGLTKAEIEALFKENSASLTERLLAEIQRKKNLSYGN